MTRNNLILFAITCSTLSLAGAFFFQYVMAILPCHLCLLQRYPHAALVVVGLVALAIPGRLLPLLGALIAGYSAVLALYHSGVERKLWAGPSDCTGGQDLGSMSAQDLINPSLASPIVQCDQISWSILGLSFANLNVLLSVTLVVIWVFAARRN